MAKALVFGPISKDISITTRPTLLIINGLNELLLIYYLSIAESAERNASLFNTHSSACTLGRAFELVSLHYNSKTPPHLGGVLIVAGRTAPLLRDCDL